MTLYSRSPCPDDPPWLGGAPVLVKQARPGLAVPSAQVDVRPVRALLDTGAGPRRRRARRRAALG